MSNIHKITSVHHCALTRVCVCVPTCGLSLNSNLLYCEIIYITLSSEVSLHCLYVCVHVLVYRLPSVDPKLSYSVFIM